MSEAKTISPREHKRQIRLFIAQRPCYVEYAATLKRLLETACAQSMPAAFVQARAKTVSSFAEKCVRRFATYPDAINQMTDLCGARVIVQTLDQVTAVRQFIRARFRVVEEDEKGLQVAEDKFGYRDLHFIVQVDERHCKALQVPKRTFSKVRGLKAEIQVRTWVQHAWADTLHDRIYKAKLKYMKETRRSGSLLAALMEDGDRAFNRLAGEIDGMLANYSAYASKDDVNREVEVQQLILRNEPDAGKKPQTALQLGRLVAACGDYQRAARVLEPYRRAPGPQGCEIRLELGHALCRVHRASPRSAGYRRGQAMLADVVAHCECEGYAVVPDIRRARSVYARALARLAWAWEAVPGAAHRARDFYRRALERENGNPYYLADVLGYEILCGGNADFVPSMAAAIRDAIRTCREHAVNGTELPYACFTAGRLHLLLDEPYAALNYYARGIWHVLAGSHCVPRDAIPAEVNWLVRVAGARKPEGGCLWARQLLDLAGTGQSGGRGDDTVWTPKDKRNRIAPPVLIVAGGAVSMPPAMLRRVRPILAAALANFKGTVIAGGTTVGIPGCVCNIAAGLARKGRKQFDLVAYIPRQLPSDAPMGGKEVHGMRCPDEVFSPSQIMRCWRDILGAGISPADVKVLGFGGGELSAVDYRVALALGACVGLAAESGGAADSFLEDECWAGAPGLFALPFDNGSIRSFVLQPDGKLDKAELERMAMALHAKFVEGSVHRLPPNMRPWDNLDQTYVTASIEQARNMISLLDAAGFGVRTSSKPKVFTAFAEAEVARMAELEHGRWNVERLRSGWRQGKERDDAHMIHDCILPWDKLPMKVRRYDYDAVKEFAAILAKAGIEVFRRRS